MTIDIHAHQYPELFRNEFKRLVEAAEGKVWLESPGQARGTAIHFTWRKVWPVHGAKDEQAAG